MDANQIRRLLDPAADLEIGQLPVPPKQYPAMDIAIKILSNLGAVIALLGFIKGVIEYMHANAIKRYEKFHEMSVRFDDNESIQKVCRFLSNPTQEDLNLARQDKEVFICFIEEIYFMTVSGIANRNLALYTFGYYARAVYHCGPFWEGISMDEPFYTHFVTFARQAEKYDPAAKGSLKF